MSSLLSRDRPDVVTSLFGELPVLERFHIRARAISAPLEVVAARTPPGRVLELGCGHGLLSAMLARAQPQREVLGVDPDLRKIVSAQRSAQRALPNVRFEQGTVEGLAARAAGTFDAVVVADVLYLLPRAQWPHFLSQAHALLRPGGRFLLKEARGDRSWKHYKCLAQEWLMVRLLRRTHGSGGLSLLDEPSMKALLAQTGFSNVTVLDLSSGYSTPHVLYEAERLE